MILSRVGFIFDILLGDVVKDITTSGEMPSFNFFPLDKYKDMSKITHKNTIKIMDDVFMNIIYAYRLYL
jgi:hypothetical protein